ncbi:MAG: anthrax toxin-like adenylyl cyclase domain-containing protein [Vicinamibacterales bacterium]
MLRGDVAVLETGMPLQHGRVFQMVADQTRCVISSRAVGKMATGLLLESYATKGFHNKAKSCPWGPMAGFVMADPRFTKNPDTQGQRTDLIKSHGGEIQLYITDERRKALEGPLKRIVRAGGTINEMQYTAGTPDGGNMRFVLKRTMDAPGASGRILWAVFYAPEEVRLSNSLTAPNRATAATGLLPVMAMVDPSCPSSLRTSYRAATTGDYDLWAVFPERQDYSRTGADQRMVPGSDRFKTPISAYIQYEDPHRGNLTPRIAQIRALINQGVAGIGYKGGDVVHHSDEAGRPMVSSIDFPCIAFVPGAAAYCIENTTDLMRFVGILAFRYVITLNPGWFKQLGITVSHVGHYEV